MNVASIVEHVRAAEVAAEAHGDGTQRSADPCHRSVYFLRNLCGVD